VRLAELAHLERLVVAAPPGVAREIACTEGLPIFSFQFGTPDPRVPALLVTGGVHGIERVGTAVAIAFLEHLLARLPWDALLASALSRCRIIVVPLVNPVGMARGTRANGNGVDLMRNAPAHSTGGTPLLGGQQLSARLPWYMGPPGAAMELETACLVELVERELFSTPFAIALDLHSGFGIIDRLWYPYARTREAPPDQIVVDALERLLDRVLPNHVYRVEQTARAYTIRGDLWDYVYDRRRAVGSGILLPLTLEMGWGTALRGRRRTLRRHLALLEFLFHLAASYATWL
jgi:predicted deacylase